MFFNSRSRKTFDRLVEQIKSDAQNPYVKYAIYSALFEIAGRPPREWPGINRPVKPFKESDIDWEKVAFLETQLDRP
jgi:hypothetical protein